MECRERSQCSPSTPFCNEPANVALGMEGQKWVWLHRQLLA
jgi:hypothetical protein